MLAIVVERLLVVLAVPAVLAGGLWALHTGWAERAWNGCVAVFMYVGFAGVVLAALVTLARWVMGS